MTISQRNATQDVGAALVELYGIGDLLRLGHRAAEEDSSQIAEELDELMKAVAAKAQAAVALLDSPPARTSDDEPDQIVDKIHEHNKHRDRKAVRGSDGDLYPERCTELERQLLQAIRRGFSATFDEEMQVVGELVPIVKAPNIEALANALCAKDTVSAAERLRHFEQESEQLPLKDVCEYLAACQFDVMSLQGLGDDPQQDDWRVAHTWTEKGVRHVWADLKFLTELRRIGGAA